jgi:hypothetical protein
MQMRKRTAWLGSIALCGGMAAIGLVPALAAPAPSSATVSILAQSNFPPISNNVFVGYRGGAGAQAQISGDIMNATTGQVIELFAQTFPFKAAPVEIGSSTLTVSSSDTPYQFTVTPSVATKYTADLVASASDTTPLAVSPSATVYVVHEFKVKGGRICGRPVCHETFKVYEVVAPSALRREMSKKVYVYFGLRFSRTGLPTPKKLTLGAGGGHASKPRKINSHEYEYTVTYSFAIGDHGYHFVWDTCQKDTESKDGFNLPGHHGCGLRTLTLKKIEVYVGTSNGGPAGVAAQARAAQ